MSNSSAALALYIWLVGNQNGYKFAFSPQSIQNQLGMPRSSCHGAVRKLIDLGYLIRRGNDSNAYDFYEVSPYGEKPPLDFSDPSDPSFSTSKDSPETTVREFVF